MRRDVTNCPRIHSEDRGVNTKEWILCNKEEALFKETQIKTDSNDSTYADYSEVIVSDICSLLDSPCQRTELAKRNDKDGCICYSFVRPKKDELIDIGTVIQGVRDDFNSKSMVVQSTKESYGIDLLVEGIDAFCRSKKEAAIARKELIEQILIDSLIDHYDRNPSNLAMLVSSESIRLSPKYDNGTSLSISVPEYVLKQYLDNPGTNLEKHNVLRENVNSKIGYLGRKYVKYPDLETYIFNYYFDDTKDITKRIDSLLTEESIDKILSDEKYSNLPSTQKDIIKMKLLANKEAMLERSQKISKKIQIDSILFNKNARQNFTNNVNKGIIPELIPEYEKCIDMPIEDVDYEGTMDEIIPDKIQNITDIQELARYFKIPIDTLSKREKNLLKWVTIIESIQKSDPTSNPLQSITSRLGFVKEDIELINKLIKDKFKDANDISEARELIYGDTGIGAENINLYIAKKFIDATVMKREVRDIRTDELRTYAATMYEAKEINDFIANKPNIFKPRNFQTAGLDDRDQIIKAQIEIAQYMRRKPRTNNVEVMKYLRQVCHRMTGNPQKEVSEGIYINQDDAEKIEQNTITLENGLKIVILNHPGKLQNAAFKMGIDYYGQIIAHPSGNGVTAYFLSRKGLPFPEEFDKFATKFKSDNESAFGSKSIVYKSNMGSKGTNCFYVSSIDNPDARIPDVTEKEFKTQVLTLFGKSPKDKDKTEEVK